MIDELEPLRHCYECGYPYDSDEEGYWGFCSETCYDEFVDSCSE